MKAKPLVVILATVTALFVAGVFFLSSRKTSLVDILGDRWLVLADPLADTLVGLVHIQGAGLQTGCYRYDSLVVTRGLEELRDTRINLLGGDAGLKLLQSVGLSVERHDFQRARITAHGWKMYRAHNLRPNPSASGCFNGDNAMPRYPTIGEALALDSFSIDILHRSGKRLVLDTTRVGGAGAATGKIDVIDSTTLRIRGLGLTVGVRAVAFDTTGADFTCSDDVTLVPTGRLYSICNGAAKVSIGVTGLITGENKYTLRVRNDARPVDPVTVIAGLGERIDIEVSTSTWERLFLNPSRFDGFVHARYIRTPFEPLQYTKHSAVPESVRLLLPPLEAAQE